MQLGLHFGLLVSVFVCVSQHGQCEPKAGVQVLVSTDTLSMTTGDAERLVKDELYRMTFDDVEESDWKLSKIKLSDVGNVDCSISFGARISLSCSLSKLEIKANWWGRKSLGWLGYISDRGRLTAKATSVSFTVGYYLFSGRHSCSANIGNVNLDFSGGFWSFLYDLIANFFEDNIARDLEDQMCETVSDVINDLKEKYRNTISGMSSMKVLGQQLASDNSGLEDERPVDGTPGWNDVNLKTEERVFLDPDHSDFGIAFDLTEHYINRRISRLVERGLMNGRLSYENIIQNDWDAFFLTCKEPGYCMGNVLQEIAEEFPDRVVGMKWNIDSALADMKEGQVFGEFIGRIHFSADSGNDSSPLFSAQMSLLVPYQLRFSGSSVITRAVGLGGQVSIDNSYIGPVLSKEDLEYMETYLLTALKENLLELINDYDTDYDFLLGRNVNVRTSSMDLEDGVVRIEVDFCEKKECLFADEVKWFGSTEVADLIIGEI